MNDLKIASGYLLPRNRLRFSVMPLAITLLTLLQLSFASMASPLRAEPMTVTHAQGETALPDRPKKVFTFDLASLETLDALGVEVAGVIGSNIPDHLAKYRDDKYLKIGSLFEPDYETINAAQPDLIIVAGRSSPKYRQLAQIAPTIDLSTDDSTFLESAFRNARTLGRIFGKEPDAEQLIGKLQQTIDELKVKARSAGRGLIILTTGGRISAYGPQSRFGALHRDFGIAVAIDDLDKAIHGQSVSFEFILQTDPDWLFVVDRDAAIGQKGQPAAQLLDNALIARTKAAQNKRIIYLDAARWYLIGGGIVSMQANADQIATALDAKP
ncbi:siderophore ABC transporter substrate-binding protein [Hyphomicrobium sp. D-2]|uniref:siderophore ABC transporter substrate-binding protein n=1 Tax=Hyphomicrobium sp. D-2 TaxID=3041621 RepID=UPI0024574EB7|nr:siderophore ABC transporter substrate-binding protein [Hyphomicrobium sp. D-2]MDH4982146.1 siderophore ABC transporter substrate-binding protein [Hyphomicrobium sp. D-2]